MFAKFTVPAIMLALLAACSEQKPAPQAAAASQPATAQAAAAVGNNACSEVFIGNNSMVYDKSTLTINKTQCKEFTVTVRNIGHLPRRSRGHNFVIAKDTDEKAILAEGVVYGAKDNFLKPNDPRVIAYTPLVGGGEEQSVTFSTEQFAAGNNYVFFCSFLGHRKMRGKVNIIE